MKKQRKIHLSKRLTALLLMMVLLIGILPVSVYGDVEYGHTHEMAYADDWQSCTQTLRCWYCTVPGCLYNYEEYIAGPGHSFVDSVSSYPTCTEPGIGSAVCQMCGYSTQYTIPANGHSFSDYITAESATCSSGGTAYRYCYNCGYEEWITTSPTYNHSFGGWTTIYEPTCSDYGLRQSSCYNCGYTQEDYTSPLGHDYEVSEKLADCEQGGTLTYTCKRCGATKTEEVDALGHDFDDGVIIESPTYYTSGKIRYTCKRCGKEEEKETDPLEIPSYVFTTQDPEKDIDGAPALLINPLCLDVIDTDHANKPGENDFTVYKTIYNMPGNGEAFTVDEVILFEIQINNRCDYDDMVSVVDPLIEESTGGLDGYHETHLEPATSHAVIFPYTVTMEDAERGYVENTAYVYDVDDGEYVTNTLYVKIMPFADEKTLTIEKSITNLPESGYFSLGETVSCDITIRNESENDIYVSEVLDYTYKEYLDGDFTLTPGEEKSWTFDHVIDDQDVEKGYFQNCATVEYDDSKSRMNFEFSNTVYADVARDNAEDSVTLVQEADNSPANGMYFVEGEEARFKFTITNNSDQPLECTMLEILEERHYEFAHADPTIAPGASAVVYYSHTILPEDVEDGYIWSTGKMVALRNEEYVFATSNEVTRPTGREPENPDQGEVFLWKSVTSTPPNGEKYVVGDEVEYSFEIFNGTPDEITDVYIDDYRISSSPIAYIPTMISGETQTFTVKYTVTATDAYFEEIINYGSAEWYDKDGNYHYVESNDVYVPVEWCMGLYIEKYVTNAPANGEYFVLGEKIEYGIYFENTGSIDFDYAEVYDSLADGSGFIQTTAPFAQGDGFYCPFSYVVTQDDVDLGYVRNYACVIGYITDGDLAWWDETEVYSPTGKINDDWGHYVPKENPPAPLESDDTYCRRTLSPLGEDGITYKVENCSAHTETDELIIDAVEAAETDEERLEAWTDAAEYWKNDILDMFDELLVDTTDSSARLIIMNLNTAFFEQIETYEKVLAILLPDDPVKAAEMKVVEMKRFCTDLCCILHDPEQIAAKTDKDVCEAIEGELCAITLKDEEPGSVYANYSFCKSHSKNGSKLVQLLTDTANEKLTWAKCAKAWKVSYAGLVRELSEKAEGNERTTISGDCAAYSTFVKMWEIFTDLVCEEEDTPDEMIVRSYVDRITAICEIK